MTSSSTGGAATRLLLGLAIALTTGWLVWRGLDRAPRSPSADTPDARPDLSAVVAPIVETPAAVESERASPATTRSPTDLSPTPRPAASNGFTVVGRLLDARGAPVSGAIAAWGPAGSEPPTRIAGALSEPDGRFELHLRRPATVDLLAQARRIGTALVTGVELSPDTAEPLDVVLRGPGLLRGRVVEPSGVPVPGLELDAVADSLGATFTGFRYMNFEPDGLLLERRAEDGLLFATTLTDLEGRFACSGLQAGEWWLRVAWEDAPLSTEPVLADGQEITLTLQRPRLVVRVREVSGRIEPADPRERLAPDPWKWPETLRAVVLADPAGSPGGRDGPVGCRILGDARVFPVEAGRRYVVGLLGGAEPWRPRSVLAGPGTTEVELVRTPAAGMGTLVIEATDKGGVPVTSGFELGIEDPETGVAVARWGSSARFSPWPRSIELPTGAWRVVLEGRAWIDGEHGTLVARRTLGRFEALVHVSIEEARLVRAVVPAGARLQLTVIGEDPDEGLASLTLQAEGRRPVPVLIDTGAVLDPLRPELAPGRSALSEVLPAGHWTLEGRLGERVATIPVALVDGATTPATLRFE
jgi:hypothetical protein